MNDDAEGRAVFLLGAEAGLHMSEIIALEWGDVDLVTGKLTVRRSFWHGIVGSPKGGRERTLPLTARPRTISFHPRSFRIRRANLEANRRFMRSFMGSARQRQVRRPIPSMVRLPQR